MTTEELRNRIVQRALAGASARRIARELTVCYGRLKMAAAGGRKWWRWPIRRFPKRLNYY
jgi:hypothetical protein